MRTRANPLGLPLALIVATALVGCATRAVKPTAKAPEATVETASQAAEPDVQWVLEPKALELLKAASNRLAAARTMRFTAVVSYEHPSRLGPALVYTTTSEVTVQRPDKLRVLTSADGPPSEFYYDGKTIMAYTPKENMAAVAEAPATIDGALKAAYDQGETYFPFTDVIVADPYGDIADSLKLAFYVGQSKVVGGTTTDIVAYASDTVFAQIWIGAEDKLPRKLRAVYRHDPSRLRHDMELSNWRLDASVPASTFTSAAATKTKRIAFAPPDPIPAAEATPPAKSDSPEKN